MAELELKQSATKIVEFTILIKTRIEINFKNKLSNEVLGYSIGLKSYTCIIKEHLLNKKQ